MTIGRTLPPPMPVPVKICGLTRPEDAEAAIRLGASYLGVIFAGGPRMITVERAREISRVGAQVPVIGVFGSQGRDEILQVRDRAGLSGAQLHGPATPDMVSALMAEGLLVLPVVRIAGEADLERLEVFRSFGCPLLVEPRVQGRLGGTGVALPLELAQRARSRLADAAMFLAGGLRPETVEGAIRAVRPDAVDVSSGVEQIPGIKDHQRMARFLEVCRCL